MHAVRTWKHADACLCPMSHEWNTIERSLFLYWRYFTCAFSLFLPHYVLNILDLDETYHLWECDVCVLPPKTNSKPDLTPGLQSPRVHQLWWAGPQEGIPSDREHPIITIVYYRNHLALQYLIHCLSVCYMGSHCAIISLALIWFVYCLVIIL